MPYWAVIISIALGLVTIYLSCIFSARRAAKISPIDAIRSNTDIKIKSKKIKCPKLVSKIFGIGGEIAYKNLKRTESLNAGSWEELKKIYNKNVLSKGKKNRISFLRKKECEKDEKQADGGSGTSYVSGLPQTA